MINTYLDQLDQDKDDLVTNLTEKGITGLTGDETFTELVPEVLNIPSSILPTFTSLNDFNNYWKQSFDIFDNYLKSVVNNYEPYTNQSITLYTPDIDCTNYVIQKKSDNTYRVVWAKENFCYATIVSNTSEEIIGFGWAKSSSTYVIPESVSDLKQNYNVLFITASLDQSRIKFYYSNNFPTLQELIQALQDSTGQNITYTFYNGGYGFSAIVDNDWKAPMSNCPIFDRRNNNNTIILDGKRVSNNETIEVISTT